MKRKTDVVTQLNAQEVWENAQTSRIEEQCMSPFIEEVSNEIAEIIGVDDLEFIDRECNIGEFRADLLYKDTVMGDFIVIENQLGVTNHDHLGKCITYLANIQAKTFVWICEKFRPEHIKAIETLNEITNDEYRFYALELHFEKIEDSEPYYFFQEIVVPTMINKEANNVRMLSSERREQFASLEVLMRDIEKEIPCAHFNNNKSFHKIALRNKIFLGLNISLKKDKLIFEMGTDDDCQKKHLREIAENLNQKNKYHFNFSNGLKNRNLDKWRYMPDWSNWRNEKENIKKICINMYNAIR